MDNCRLILNSNSLCVICLSEVEAKVSKADLFPLHHLTSKINSNLGSVFKDVTVPWAPSAVMDRLEVLADVCEGCGDLCDELLYRFQDDVLRENCIQSILDKMEGVRLEDKYKNCGSPVAVFYAGIVDRLRKEIIEKLRKKLGEKLSELATGALTGLQGIPGLINIPDLPITQIFSYLPFEDIINCSTVSKDVRHLILPSLIKSSLITLKHRDQIPALIDFIKAITNNVKAGASLFIDFYNDSDGEDGLDRQDNLLKVFQECGPSISHLKLRFKMMDGDSMFGFPNYTSIPVCCGNELLPNLKRLELDYFWIYCESASDLSLNLPLIYAILGNSPNLKELKLICNADDAETEDLITPKLLKLIGESGLPITTLGIDGSDIDGSEMGYLQPLNLEKVVIKVFFDLTDVQTWTKFLESQSSTLKYFRLKSKVPTSSHFTFPRMEALETFELISVRSEEPDEEEGPIFSRSQLPKLNRLLVQHRDVDVLPTLFPSDAESTANVKELRLLLPTLDKGVMIRTMRLFELSKLEIPVASYLNEVWKDLSGLEELTLLQNDTGAGEEKPTWIDGIITGLTISRKALSAITEEDIREFDEAHEKIKTEKSMTLLTRLRLLRLRQGRKYYLGRLMLSDISCRLVLMKMESLKCIDFSGIHPSFVGASAKVLAKMGKKMELYFGEKQDWYYKSLSKNQKKTTWTSMSY